MDKSKKAKTYATVATICLALVTVYWVRNSLKYVTVSEYNSIAWQRVVWCLIYGYFTVLFFIKKKNIGLLVAAGAGVLMGTYYLTNLFDLQNLLRMAVYASLFALFLFNVIPSLSKNVEITKILCFVSVGFNIAYIIDEIWITYSYQYKNLNYMIYMLMQIMACVGFLLADMWLLETVPVQNKAETVNDNPYSKFDPSLCQSAPSTAGADTLKTYKDLLDSGAITQEEFDAKKKQLLKLM